MVRAKNYETVSKLTFVKVMQKKPWPLFGHGVYLLRLIFVYC